MSKEKIPFIDRIVPTLLTALYLIILLAIIESILGLTSPNFIYTTLFKEVLFYRLSDLFIFILYNIAIFSILLPFIFLLLYVFHFPLLTFRKILTISTPTKVTHYFSCLVSFGIFILGGYLLQRSILPHVTEIKTLSIYFIFYLICLVLYIFVSFYLNKINFSFDLFKKSYLIVGLVVVFLIMCFTLYNFDKTQNLKSIFLEKQRNSLSIDILHAIYKLTDFDGDGFSFILGGGDKNNFDDTINPIAVDMPNNSIDENTINGDFIGPSSKNSRYSYKSKTSTDMIKGLMDCNIIFIMVDTLRYDHLGCYGYHKKDISPHLDKLCKDSIQFSNAYSQCCFTAPSVASMFTSCYPSTHNLLSHFPPSDNLDESFQTMAEILQKNDYHTAAIVAHPYIINSKKGLTQGFKEWYAFLGEKLVKDEKQLYEELAPNEHPKGYGYGKPMTEFVIHWLDDHRQKSKEKFFLYIHYMDVHSPYDTVPENITFGYEGPLTLKAKKQNIGTFADISEKDLSYLINLYDYEITYVDDCVGKILNKLNKIDKYRNTMIIFVSDHGDGFKEHGYLQHRAFLYNDLIKIPLIIKLPHEKYKNTVIDQYVQHIDLLPTLADFLSIEDRNFKFQGNSLLPLISGIVDPYKNRLIFSEVNRKQYEDGTFISIISNPWKLIYNPKKTIFKLFNMATDKKELYNIIDQEKKVVAQLKPKLIHWWEEQKYNALKFKSGKGTVLDERTKRALESLGYLNK